MRASGQISDVEFRIPPDGAGKRQPMLAIRISGNDKDLHMIRTLLAAVSALLLGLMSAAVLAGDPVAGKQKSALCAACHGPDGNSVNPIWPSIAGQHAEYLAAQLRDYRDGRRSEPQMSPMAATLSDEDIADLAAWFASQQARIGAASPEHLELGQTLYRAGNPETGVPACAACHGPNGHGNPAASYPAIGGQHGAYTAAQLRAFKAEQRSNDLNRMMRMVAGRMSEKEIEAIADYLQGLH
jgi:cytochrome c553